MQASEFAEDYSPLKEAEDFDWKRWWWCNRNPLIDNSENVGDAEEDEAKKRDEFCCGREPHPPRAITTVTTHLYQPPPCGSKQRFPSLPIYSLLYLLIAQHRLRSLASKGAVAITLALRDTAGKDMFFRMSCVAFRRAQYIVFFCYPRGGMQQHRQH